jgi:transcriptional regulator with XRE-family HTH domain
MEFIGQNIKKLRKQRGVMQKQLASDIGISVSYLSLIESGHKVPSLQTIIYIAKCLEVDPSFIVTQNKSYFAIQNILKEEGVDRILSNLQELYSRLGEAFEKP